jgi:hypothetical protein
LVLLINQNRYKIGVTYGSNVTQPGGVGIKFASSVILEMRAGEWIEEDHGGEKLKIGRRFKGRTDKNKTYPPYRIGEFSFYFAGPRQGQIDNAESLATYALILGLVTQKGSFYTVEGHKVQGKTELADFFRDPKNYERYEKEVRRLYIK